MPDGIRDRAAIVVEIDDDDDAVAGSGGEQMEVDVSDEDAPAELPRGARYMADGSVVLQLRQPIVLRSKKAGVLSEESIEALHLHRLNGADMKAISMARQGEAAAVGIARSARMNEMRFAKAYDGMDAADIVAAAGAARDALERYPPDCP